MIEFVLVLVIAVVLGYHAWYVHETNKQLREYMKGFMAKNLEDYAVAKKIEEPEAKKEEPLESDVVLESEADDRIFSKILSGFSAKREELDNG